MAFGGYSMAKIVLIACARGKRVYSAKAGDLYTSRLFQFNLRYARSLRPDSIFILSAKHGLIPSDEIIAPYNVTLNKMPVKERRAWAEKVVRQLDRRADLLNDEFVILAGVRYREFLIPHLRRYNMPLEGMPIGKQLQWLKRRIEDV